MIGGDERAAVHATVTAVIAGDRAAALAGLEVLLLSLGRVTAAVIVAGAADHFSRAANRFGWDGRAGPVKG